MPRATHFIDGGAFLTAHMAAVGARGGNRSACAFSKNNIDKFVDNELKENANLEVEELVKRVLKKM